MTTIKISDRWYTDLFLELPRRPVITLKHEHRGALPERVWMAFDQMALELGHNASTTIEVSDSELAAIIQADERLRSQGQMIRQQRRYSGSGRW